MNGLLIHQLPPKLTNLRVSVSRRRCWPDRRMDDYLYGAWFTSLTNRRFFVVREEVRWVFVDRYAARILQAVFGEAAAE